jgi:hypothetical protein
MALPSPGPLRPSQFGIWDVLVWMSLTATFLAVFRHVGVIAVLVLPGLFLGRSVLAHPANRQQVKILFIAVNVLLALWLVFLPYR